MIKLYLRTFYRVLLGMLAKPMWLLLLISLSIMSLVYIRPVLWDLPVAIINQDHSSASRLLMNRLDTIPKIKLHSYDDLARARADMRERKLFAIILIPIDFEKSLLNGKNITVPVYGDGTNRLASGQIQQEISSAYIQLLNEYNTQRLRNAGFTDQQASTLLTPIKGITEPLFNPGPSFAAIVFPGLLVMLLQHSLLVACVKAYIDVHKAADGKISSAVYLGAWSALLPIWLFLSAIFFALWPWVLGYRQEAPLYQLVIVTLPFLLAVLGLGKFVTEFLRSVEMIYLTLAFLTTPVFYISGAIWPLQAMPDWVRMVAYSLPSTWAIKAIAGINQLDLSLSDVGIDILMMLMLGTIYALLGILINMLRSGELRQFSHHLRCLLKRKKRY